VITSPLRLLLFQAPQFQKRDCGKSRSGIWNLEFTIDASVPDILAISLLDWQSVSVGADHFAAVAGSEPPPDVHAD
jgi:hypothetical protein